MVVADKKAVNLTIPIPVIGEYEAMASDLKRKEKWMVVTAAMLMLMEVPEPVRNYYINQAGSADLAGGSFQDLIDRAKTGELRAEAEERSSRAIGGRPGGVRERLAAHKDPTRKG